MNITLLLKKSENEKTNTKHLLTKIHVYFNIKSFYFILHIYFLNILCQVIYFIFYFIKILIFLFLGENTIVGVTDQGTHTNIYVGPRTQSKEELLFSQARPRTKGTVCH